MQSAPGCSWRLSDTVRQHECRRSCLQNAALPETTLSDAATWRGLATSIDAANYWRTLDHHLHCPMTLYYSKITHTHKCDSKKRLNMKQTSSTLNRNNHSKFQLPFFSVLPFTTTAITTTIVCKNSEIWPLQITEWHWKKGCLQETKTITLLWCVPLSSIWKMVTEQLGPYAWRGRKR